MLTELEKEAAKGQTWETTEYKLSKAILSQIASTAHTLYHPSVGGPCICSTYIVLSIMEGLKNPRSVTLKTGIWRIPPNLRSCPLSVDVPLYRGRSHHFKMESHSNYEAASSCQIHNSEVKRNPEIMRILAIQLSMTFNSTRATRVPSSKCDAKTDNDWYLGRFQSMWISVMRCSGRQ